MTIRPGVGGATITAHVDCSKCGGRGHQGFGAMFPPDQMDKKFSRAGWRLDPNICPTCVRAQSKEKTMANSQKPTAAAMRAQAAMFRLLSDHFDIDTGRFSAGWSDKKIADDTGLSVDVVIEFRRAGFGEMQEAPELAALRADINALAALQREHNGVIAQEIATLRARVMKLADA